MGMGHPTAILRKTLKIDHAGDAQQDQ
jgi:hypothetical protein